MAISKDALLAARDNGTAVVELPVGEVVVRGLTRKEALSLQKKEMDVSEMEVRLLSMALVDPLLTEDEVRQLQSVSPAGELEPVSEKILELSGMKAEQVKESLKRFPQ